MEPFSKILATLVALAVAVGPSGFAQPCRCAAKDVSSPACCAKTAVSCCAEGHGACCCSQAAADEAARDVATRCGDGWIPGCCCSLSAPQAPGKSSSTPERGVSDSWVLPAAELPAVASRAASAIPLPPDGLRPTRPPLSILYCVWRE